jgi:hypothetical protein
MADDLIEVQFKTLYRGLTKKEYVFIESCLHQAEDGTYYLEKSEDVTLSLQGAIERASAKGLYPDKDLDQLIRFLRKKLRQKETFSLTFG